MSSDCEKEKSTEDMAKNEKSEDAGAAAATASKEIKSDDKKQVGDGADKDTKSAVDDEEKSKDDKADDSDEKKSKLDGADADEKNEQKNDSTDDKEKPTDAAVGKDKEKNGTTEKKKDSAKKGVEEGDEDKDEDDRVPMPLGEIAKINENITKTKVEGLQTLHTICYDSPGKANVMKKNLRKFAGFNISAKSDEYKAKVTAAEKFEVKLLKGVCDVLDLDNNGSKEELAARILEFLLIPEGDPEKEEEEDEEEPEEEVPEEPSSEEEGKRKRKRVSERGSKASTGRPKRSTAGKSNRDLSTYVDYSSSDESGERHFPTVKKRRKRGGSDSGSDYNPSAGSESDGARKRPARGGRGRPPARRGGRRRNSDSEEEEESPSFDEDSDVEPKKKRGSVGGRAGRNAGGRAQPARNRRGRKRNETESEDEEEESDFESDNSEEVKKKKGRQAAATATKANSRTKQSPANARGRRPNKSKKNESSDEENDAEKDGESEDEPLAKKSKNSPPTDEEIKVYVKEILDEANLEEITMKTVCKQVYAKYPDFDLTDKKDFIKATVKSLIAA